MKGDDFSGFIRAKDIMSHHEDPGRKISDIMELVRTDNITLDSRKSIREAYSVMEKYGVTKVIIKEGDKVIGQVSAFDILRLFSGIKLTPDFKNRQDIPIVRDILDKECPCVKKETRISEISELFLRQDADIVVIQDERYIGEITRAEFITGISRYGQRFKENIVSQSMSSVHSINPDTDIFDANEYIIERGFSAYPVIINDTLLGIIRPMRLLKEILAYLSR
jgi:predicted transcriptional regulator